MFTVPPSEINSEYSIERKIEHVQNINGALKTFANDIEFHEDLQSPIVKKALSHWFNA